MKQYAYAPKVVLVLALIATTICIAGFRGKDSTSKKSFRTETFRGDEDTTPPRKRNRASDDLRTEKLDEAMKKLDMEMSKLDEHMKKLDFSKMQQEIEQSLKKVDFEKIGKEVEASMKKVDWDKMQVEINNAMEKVKNIDFSKMHEEMAKMKVELEKQKEMHFDSDKMRADVDKAMQKARAGMEKAREEMGQIRKLTTALQKDGLIDKSKPYKIELKDGELFINDKKQPKEVIEKYREYIKKDNFIINSGGKDNLDRDHI